MRQEEFIEKLFDQYHTKTPFTLPPHSEFDHKIIVTADPTKAIKPRKLFKTSSKCEEYEQTEVERLEKAGMIYRVHHWTSYVTSFVTTSANKLRLVIDYSQLNAIVQPMPTEIKAFNETLINVSGKVFSKLDFEKAYHHVRLTEDSEPLTTFRCHEGVFRWRVLLFGYIHSVECWTRYMTAIFGDLSYCCKFYLDDGLVFSDNIEDHKKHLKLVFERISKYKLHVSRQKCQFFVNELDWVGHHIRASPAGVELHPSDDTLEKIKSFRPPKSKKELMSFLGQLSYISDFFPNFATLSEPLTRLLKKDAHYHWSDECQSVFEKIKTMQYDHFSRHPFQVDKPVKISCDASDYACGAVLWQLDSDSTDTLHWYPVEYRSQKFDAMKRKWPIIDKEMYAIKFACSKFHFYIANRPQVLCLTDHKPIIAVFQSENPSPKHARVIADVAQYNLLICHISGETNDQADYLSRWDPLVDPPDPRTSHSSCRHPLSSSTLPSSSLHPSSMSNPKLLSSSSSRPNSNHTETTMNFFISASSEQPVTGPENNLPVTSTDSSTGTATVLSSSNSVEPPDLSPPITEEPLSTDTQIPESSTDSSSATTSAPWSPPSVSLIPNSEEIKSFVENYAKDPFFSKIYAAVNSTPELYPSYHLDPTTKLLYFQTCRLCVPAQSLQLLLDASHSDIFGGHPGAKKMKFRMRSRYHFANFNSVIDNYVKSCSICHRVKPRTFTAGPLQQIPIPTQRWHTIAMDVVSGFGTAKWFATDVNAILVIVDLLTCRCHFYPLNTSFTTLDIVTIFLRYYFPLHGVPSMVISDRARQFVSTLAETLSNQFDIDRHLSTATVHQSNGKCERYIRICEDYLRCYVVTNTDWIDLLPLAEFTINSMPSLSLNGISPFEADLGYVPDAPETVVFPLPQKGREAGAEDMVELLDHYSKVARAALKAAQQKNKLQFDLHHKSVEYKVGDTVYIDINAMPSNSDVHNKKLLRSFQTKFIGPYTIVEKLSPVKYTVDLESVNRSHSEFHISSLKVVNVPPDTLYRAPAHAQMFRAYKDGTKLVEIDKIVKHKRKGKGLSIKVKFVPDSADESPDDQFSWNSLSNLVKTANRLVFEYADSHPDVAKALKKMKVTRES
ncbi:unnamed protein product [Ambrosiozyma monospora]|uniref:Unnamed protein product n=1 Tax=Ambrosiozyma monospora TaxID=43982 RepID=A0A9W7DF66_AMBMO|nr:unnamed protein product [Ambrosiozyma monospora]